MTNPYQLNQPWVNFTANKWVPTNPDERISYNYDDNHKSRTNLLLQTYKNGYQLA